MDRIYIDNTMVATLRALTDESGDAVTAATVSVTLYESDESTEVGGVSWPVTLTHDADGTYQGDLSADVEVVAGRVYKAKVVATHNGRTYTGWQDAYAERRQA